MFALTRDKKVWINTIFYLVLLIVFLINPAMTIAGFIIFTVLWIIIMKTKKLKYFVLVISAYIAIFMWLLYS